MAKKIGIVRFPGTNCDMDVWQAAEMTGLQPVWLWHENHFSPKDFVGAVVPGGFSFGDYLRCGALAAKSPVMKSVTDAAKQGLPILGICNGFQILCEAGLLPGVLVRNRNQRFIDRWVDLRQVGDCRFFAPGSRGQLIRLPVAHGEGNFQIEEAGLKDLEDHEQIWCCYRDDINGSTSQIAGVLNRNKNVAGLMPHPERAMADWMGGTDGLTFFRSLL